MPEVLAIDELSAVDVAIRPSADADNRAVAQPGSRASHRSLVGA